MRRDVDGKQLTSSMVPNYIAGQIVMGLSSSRARWGRDNVSRSWTIAAGRQISQRKRGAQSDPVTRTVHPSADEVPQGWGVEGVSGWAARSRWRGCWAVHSIGAVWFGANPCMPAGGHLEMLQALLWMGWRAATLSRVVTSGAKRGGTGGDALRRSMHVGGVGRLGERVERAGDWLSAAVVAIVALAVWGE
jgi:hypothetical protein